jgi:hypothetical protein
LQQGEKRLTPALKGCAAHSITSVGARADAAFSIPVAADDQPVCPMLLLATGQFPTQTKRTRDVDFLGLHVRLWPIRNGYQSGRMALPITFCT